MTDNTKMREAFVQACKEYGPTISFGDFECGWDACMEWQAARIVPEGFVMVPVEPTQEMLKAGERGIGVSSYVRKGMTIREYRFFKSGWDAMLAAAPEGKK